MTDFILYYFGVGYVINNIIGLWAIYGNDGDNIEINFSNFILTIPAWPYTLYSLIKAYFSKE